MASGAERQAPFCSTCQVNMTIEHILVSCSVFANPRRANFLANKSLGEILNEGDPVEQIVIFLKDINLFYELWFFYVSNFIMILCMLELVNVIVYDCVQSAYI